MTMIWMRRLRWSSLGRIKTHLWEDGTKALVRRIGCWVEGTKRRTLMMTGRRSLTNFIALLLIARILSGILWRRYRRADRHMVPLWTWLSNKN